MKKPKREKNKNADKAGNSENRRVTQAKSDTKMNSHHHHASPRLQLNKFCSFLDDCANSTFFRLRVCWTLFQRIKK